MVPRPCLPQHWYMLAPLLAFLSSFHTVARVLVPKHKVSQVPSLLNTMPSLLLSAAAAAKSLQSCPTLCDTIDGSPPGSPVPGILQARTLEWVAISFSNAWKWKVKVKSLSHVWLFATLWTAAHQAPPSMGFSRQESTGVECHCFCCLLSVKSRHLCIAQRACHGPTPTSFLYLFLASHSYVYNSVIILHFTSQSQVQKT